MSKNRPAEIKRYWSRVAELGCVVCGNDYDTTIHHVHGGSCSGLSGMGMKSSDWLVIPLCMNHHTGQYGIDNGMSLFKTVWGWEQANGTQLAHLVGVGLKLNVNPFGSASVSLDRLFDCAVSAGSGVKLMH